MLKSIIEEIFSDNQGYMEKIKPTEEYLKLWQDSCDLIDKMKETLEDSQKQDLDKLNELQIGICAEGEFGYYKEGFKIGLFLGLECLS